MVMEHIAYSRMMALGEKSKPVLLAKVAGRSQHKKEIAMFYPVSSLLMELILENKLSTKLMDALFAPKENPCIGLVSWDPQLQDLVMGIWVKS
jgi:hypothetical protein